MANATTIDEDQQQDLGQDYRAPMPTAAPAASPLQTPIVPPPAAAYRSPFLSPDEAERQTAMRRLQYSVADLPLAEAEKAVDAALKFQAQRGYQKDLASGMSAADALTKWGPTLFGSHVGTAQALSRVAARPAPRPVIVGGRAFAPMNPAMPGAPLQPITPGPIRNLDPNSPPVLEYKRLLADISHKQAEMDKNPEASAEENAANINQLQIMQQAADKLATRIRGGTAPVAAPAPRVPPAIPASTTRVRVRSKSGKIGTIPADQLAQALAEGYTRVQ
jgi:hypothetical protein